MSPSEVAPLRSTNPQSRPRSVSPSLVLFPATKKRARSPVAPDEPADMRVDLTRGDGVGKVLGDNDWGKWRIVPGFDEEKLQVSDQGYYRVHYGNGGWSAPNKGSLNLQNRYVARVDGVPYPVARLVCRAFHGPAPSSEHEADHINHDTTNDKASNLRWVTKQENRANQREVKKPKSDGRSIRIRHRDWPEERDWEEFGSTGAAAKAYGLDGSSLSAIAYTKAGSRTAHPKYQCKGFFAEWVPPVETQGKLPAGDDSNLRELPEPGDASTTEEQWKQALDYPTLWVSDRGRVQIKHSTSDCWGYKRTPQPTDGQVYATVNYKGKQTPVHTVVYLTFGRRLLEGETIDHKVPSRKFDNRLVNLRAATRSEQSLNQDHKPRSETNNSKKKAVWGKPVDAAEDAAWEHFESAIEAHRQLHARFPDKKFGDGNISKCVNGKTPAAYGWVFRRD